jgi:glycine/D-amino acid oxidase-like deaminating enzyme
MTQTDLGKNTSLWIDTTGASDYPTLSSEESRSYDSVVIGGGITGLMTAWRLQQVGLKTVLIEKNKIVEYTTGNTTAKLTSQHYLVYKHLIADYGLDVARAFAKANQDAIDEIESIGNQFGIDSDFERRDAYVYTLEDEKVREIEEEVEASKQIGLPSSFEKTTELPYDVKGAIRFTGQAQFHPRKFLLGIAKEFTKLGGAIYEQTEATNVVSGDEYIIETKKGKVKGKFLVDATKESFWQGKLFEKATWIKISYALGIRIKGAYPKGMYITTDEPMRSIRSHPYEDGQILIFGGESHKLGKDWDEDLRYNNLLKDAHQRYEVESVVYRWLAGDVMPYDRLPYIGEYPGNPRAYTATGYRAWGLAWAVAASRIITDKISGKPVEWAKPFELTRLK